VPFAADPPFKGRNQVVKSIEFWTTESPSSLPPFPESDSKQYRVHTRSGRPSGQRPRQATSKCVGPPHLEQKARQYRSRRGL
jgi:hypothetical protein